MTTPTAAGWTPLSMRKTGKNVKYSHVVHKHREGQEQGELNASDTEQVER